MRGEAEAVDKVNKLLDRNNLYMERILNNAEARRAEELVQKYVRREPDAVMLIDQLFTRAGMSMDTFMAEALADELDNVERIATTECARGGGGRI